MMSNRTDAYSKDVAYLYKGERNIAQVEYPRHDFSERINNRLEDLMNLPIGWDGYNAAPVSYENASFAHQVLNQICESNTPIPQIVPGVNGDLQIEWHTQKGSIELHIVKPYRVLFWTDDEEICPGDNEIQLETDFTQVMKILRGYMDLEEQQNARAVAAR